MYIGTDTITRCLTCNLHYYINYGGKNWYLDSFPLSECYGFPLSFYLPTKLSPTSHCLHADNVAKYCNSNLNILVSVMISCESWCDHDNKWLCVMHLLTVLQQMVRQTGQLVSATGKTNRADRTACSCNKEGSKYSIVYRVASSGKMYIEQMSHKSKEM